MGKTKTFLLAFRLLRFVIRISWPFNSAFVFDFGLLSFYRPLPTI